MSSGGPSKSRILEERRRAGVVDDLEAELVRVGVEARASPDDLLELDHRPDWLEEHDVLHRRQIDAGGEKLRRGRDHRRLRLDVGEVVEVLLPDVTLDGDDAGHVVRVLASEVGVRSVESRPHLVGVLGVDAEDDRLRHPIRSLQVLGEVLRRHLRAREQRDDALEVPRLVEVGRDLAAEEVELALVRLPAVGVGAEHDPPHAVGREEAVVDPLLERVLVDGRAEVRVGVAVVLAKRRGGHAELSRLGEVFEDRAPARVVARAPAMALVDDDQVEVVGRVVAEDPEAVAGVGERLVEREVDLAARS